LNNKFHIFPFASSSSLAHVRNDVQKETTTRRRKFMKGIAERAAFKNLLVDPSEENVSVSGGKSGKCFRRSDW
jgi:hypothetical protein